MQRNLLEEESRLYDSDITLRFPVLPGDDSIESLFQHSHLLPELDEGYIAMASQNDDSSVDESLSSMGESAWDVVDEASAASDDDVRNISRQPTPLSEQPEHIHLEAGSLAGNDTSSESQGVRPPSRMFEFSHSRKDSSSDPPDTAKQILPRPKGLFRRSSSASQRHETIPYIKFREDDLIQEFVTESQEVSYVLTEFEGRQRERFLDEYKINPKLGLAGTVKQSMRETGLLLDGAFKVLYVGPTEMKDAIVQKIASALAANRYTSPTDSLNSSRVTVVPISSFGDDSSPDVVLIDSTGLDMNIEECKSARSVLESDRSESIELKLKNHKTIKSSWSRSDGTYIIHPDYTLPDLAAIYVPFMETASTKRTREQTQAFLARHHVPTLPVTFDTQWKKRIPAMPFDVRLPHLCIESFDPDNGDVKVLDRRPVDVNTLSNLDSAQLNRSLALLAPSTISTPLSDSEVLSKGLPPQTYEPKSKTTAGGLETKHWLAKLGLMFGLMLASVAIYAQLLYYYGPIADFDLSLKVAESRASPPLLTSSISRAAPQVTSQVSTEAHELSLAPVIVAEKSDIPLTTLLQTKFEHNKSDTFQVQVVGDSHVVLRPPTWVRQLRRAPKLHFKVKRSNKELDYEFSTLFDGVYALKLLPEEAYGVLDITIWTHRKPRVNETFQVEFSTPWLKVSGWQNAAQAMTDQIREELVAAQTGLFKAYIQANRRVQFFFKDAVIRADTLLKEVEKFGLGSLASSLKSTEQMVTQSKMLTATLSQKIMKGGEKTSNVLASQRQSLADDISSYSQRLSNLFFQQARFLSDATSGLGLVALGEEIQTYREQHFREAQKTLLRAWWKVRGAPSINAKAKKEGQARANHRQRRRSTPPRYHKSSYVETGA